MKIINNKMKEKQESRVCKMNKRSVLTNIELFINKKEEEISS